MNAPAYRKLLYSLLVAMSSLAYTPAMAQEEGEFFCPDIDDDVENTEEIDPRCEELALTERDDTADIDTDSTMDTAVDREGLIIGGDFRPLVNYLDNSRRSGEGFTNTDAQARVRLKASARLSRLFGVGARVAGRCSSDDCDAEWMSSSATPQANGLAHGQFTFDEAYIHLFSDERSDLTLGRQQTRSVLRAGVFSRSLDRNDSNNTNITWTDGAHLALRQRRGWEGHVIVQHNAADGSGRVRRGQLDFAPSSARTSYYISTENLVPLGPIAQRSLSISYLPNSLLIDGVADGRRESYVGYVARMAFRWPQKTEGPRLRAGFEIGYAPEVPTSEAAGIDASVDGLAWNVALSIMEFKPRHNIGVFYSRTGAGWLLSPNFLNNEEAYEIRYQWRPRNFPAIDARIRWREDIEQHTTADRKRERVDAFLRLTWQFDL
jgi:hypothetical protein